MMWIKVKATREGLIGGKTDSGYVVETHVPFVALPSVQVEPFQNARTPALDDGHAARGTVLIIDDDVAAADTYARMLARKLNDLARRTSHPVSLKAQSRAKQRRHQDKGELLQTGPSGAR